MEDGSFLVGDFVYAPSSGKIIEPKTGEVVLAKKYEARTDGYKLKGVNHKSGLILVSKIDEGFSGNTFSLGVMNGKFEWVYPLTEITVDGWSANGLDEADYTFRGNGDCAVTNSWAFFFKENKTIEMPKIWSFIIVENSDADKFVFIGDGDKLYVFDSNTGKATEINNSSNIYAYVAGDGIAIYDYTSEKLSLLNWNDYKDMGFDLSEYDVSNEGIGIYAATEDYIAFIEKNPDGDAYTIIMRKDGSFVVDPIKGTSESRYMHIYGDYVINTYADYIVNCKTGEMKTYSDDSLRLEGFDSTSGKLIMESDGYYYLADITDPETLINPFEIAEVQ